MNTIDCFRTLARYNRIANERLYEKCAELYIAEYRRERLRREISMETA